MLLIFFFIGITQTIINEDNSIRLRQSCQTETTGYFWNGQQCVRCKIPSCICTSYLGCSSCIENYYYSDTDNICKPCPTGCSECCENPLLTQIICTLCQTDYRNVNGVCVYMGKCIQISMHGRCLECETGYYIDKSFKCQQCSTGCIDCSNTIYCNICDEGYYLQNTNQSLVCTLNSISNCQTQNNTSCTTCLKGYFLTNSNQTCQSCIEKCDSCVDSQTCDTCTYQTIPNTDYTICQNCTDIYPNCMTCTMKIIDEEKQLKCTECDNGYYMNSTGYCLNCNQADSNVRRCESLEIITQCYPGYLLLQQRYYNETSQIPNLLKYSCIKNQYECATLADEQGQCASCLDNQLLIEIDEISQCVDCTQQATNCSDCYLTPSNIFQCIECDIGYYLSTDSSSCIQCSSHCLTCESQTNCTICDTLYYVDSNYECDECNVNNCVDCSKPGNCILCEEQYGIIDGSCKQCQIGCKYCNYNQAVCTECLEGYYLYMKTCIQYPSHCLLANEVGLCYLCETIVYYDESRDEFIDEDQTTPTYKNVDDSIFYTSLNGYCLVCNNYDTGQFFCPDTCLTVLNMNSEIIILFLLFILQIII